MNKKRTALIGVGTVAAVALIGGIAWFGPWNGDGAKDASTLRADAARQAADDFARAWETGKLDTVPATKASGDTAAVAAYLTAGLSPVDGHPKSVQITEIQRSTDDTRAVASANITWKLDDVREWSYPTSISFVHESPAGTNGDGEARWLVDFKPTSVHPALQDGSLLRSSRVVPARGQILDKEGRNLTGSGGSVVVGIRPSRAEDPEATARAVAAMVDMDPGELAAKVAAANPDEFVEVITLERAAYNAIREKIQPLPGTVFKEQDDSGAPPANFARGLLGATDRATAEMADASKGAIREGDTVGVSGLQLSQNDVLSGKPGLAIEVVPVEGTARALKAFAPEPGRSVAITIDRRVQSVADATLAGTEKPSALVAIRVSTGEVLAVANGPSGSAGYNRALIGRYAPGSVFKIASGLTVLEHGTTPDTVVGCPAEISVGKTFRNAGGFSLGDVPFRTDFAKSCNTAFVGLAKTVTAQQLADTAALLGYRPLDIGAPLFGASVPTDGDATEHAAQMIGQGRVEATPLHVALATASVASGRSVQPTLVIDPDAPEAPAGVELPGDLLIQLREMMRLVITEGTGTVLADVAGGEVRGKTGTAEFGTASPPETHAWITGYQGDVAFAVLVEGGGGGGAVAGPIAAQFLNTLANG